MAHHGGGYAYRLAPADGPLTEETFRKTPLDFVGPGILRWDGDRTTQLEFPAARVSEGTVPTGSEWARNPIPRAASFWVSGEGCAVRKDDACLPPVNCTSCTLFVVFRRSETSEVARFLCFRRPTLNLLFRLPYLLLASLLLRSGRGPRSSPCARKARPARTRGCRAASTSQVCAAAPGTRTVGRCCRRWRSWTTCACLHTSRQGTTCSSGDGSECACLMFGVWRGGGGSISHVCALCCCCVWRVLYHGCLRDVLLRCHV